MNILVCISRVPDTASRIFVGTDGKTIDTQGIKFVVNPYDEFALEEALRLREKNGGTVTAVVVDKDVAKDVLRTALAMGVDKATLIKAKDNFDSYYVAKNLAKYAQQIKPDLIFVGRQSVDYDSRFIASALAELLNLPSVSVVSKLTVENDKIIAERDIEGGKEIVEAKLPCVISAQKGLNEPRYPKLPDIMKAKSKPIEEIEGLDVTNKVTILEMSIPTKQRIGKILGSEDSDIEELVKLLHEEAKVI